MDLLPLKQWVQLDLGESREIWLLWIWMFHKQFVMYKDVLIEVSDDPEFRTGRIVFNNDQDNTSGRGIGADEAMGGYESRACDSRLRNPGPLRSPLEQRAQH